MLIKKTKHETIKNTVVVIYKANFDFLGHSSSSLPFSISYTDATFLTALPGYNLKRSKHCFLFAFMQTPYLHFG